MAANLPTPSSISSDAADRHRTLPFTATLLLFTAKRAGVSFTAIPPPSASAHGKTASSSLAEQLKPLSTVTLSNHHTGTLLSKPKSTWVNPTKPKPSALSLSRHKRSSFSSNPQIQKLRHFAGKLNSCDSSDFAAVMEEVPHPITKETALLLLNSARSWEKALLFLDWAKTHNSFPLETIFYNVAMKSLRSGNQFRRVELLAAEMIDSGVPLDNITYSTIITAAKRSNRLDRAVFWFEQMYKTGLIPDEVTFSAALDVYAKLGKSGEVRRLYERGRAAGWTPDPIAFSFLAKMYGETGDFAGLHSILQEMKSLEIQPTLVLYNTLMEAMGKAGKPAFARSLFEEMVHSGVEPNEKTLTALIKIYGKARWGKDALDLWQRMRQNSWPVDLILYNSLLSMCADLGLVSEAEKLFEYMKESEVDKPDSWSYTAMLNIYSSLGSSEKALQVFDEMSERGVDLNVMGCTCLVQCLGRGKKIDELVRVFKLSMDSGVKPDDKLCCCLLSVLSCFEGGEEGVEKVFSCLQQANPKIAEFAKALVYSDHPDIVREDFKGILSSISADSRRPFCNCLIDLCRNRGRVGAAHELLYLGTLFGLYPGLHTKTGEEWRINVRSLSVGAACTAFEEWMGTVAGIVGRGEPLCGVFSASTGAGNHRLSLGLGGAFALHLEKVGAPFRESRDEAGLFVATREEVVAWVHSRAAIDS